MSLPRRAPRVLKSQGHHQKKTEHRKKNPILLMEEILQLWGPLANETPGT